MSLPTKMRVVLADPKYTRKNTDVVELALERLNVHAPSSFVDFYKTFTGPFWSNSLGVELGDLVEDRDSVECLSQECRRLFMFPDRFLVLTPLSSGGTIHVLDTEADAVYVVDLEGGEELLRRGQLEARWSSFCDFLEAYF